MNYTYVKSMAKHRSEIINDTLDMILEYYPTEAEGHRAIMDIAAVIETFFLTDHCEEEDDGNSITTQLSSHRRHRNNRSFGTISVMTQLNSHKTHRNNRSMGASIFSGFHHALKSSNAENDDTGKNVVPITKKPRRSFIVRAADEEQLHRLASSLLVEDDRDQYKQSNGTMVTGVQENRTHASVAQLSDTVIDDILENRPYICRAIAAIALSVLWVAQHKSVTIDLDVAMLISFGFFCLGLNIPRRSRRTDIDTAPVAPKYVAHRHSFENVPETSTRHLVRKSIMASATSELAMAAAEVAAEDKDEECMGFGSPIPMLPEGSENNHTDCVSIPKYSDFKIRGSNYLVDHIKIPSGPYLFPVRGVDLFLTDSCPGNVGSITGMMGGRVREVPTLIFNFVLPWGVLIFYSEIPDKFLQVFRSKYDSSCDLVTLPSMESMTPGERTVCRWITGDDKHKNLTLKIVPVVRKGPWIVKSVVGGKPALMGILPINYIYSPRVGDKAEYFEVDLEVVEDSVARRIASVCTRATKGLTIDLGFVIQGNSEDELPEQMIMGVRLNKIDPLNAPALPPMKNMYIEQAPSLDNDDGQSVT